MSRGPSWGLVFAMALMVGSLTLLGFAIKPLLGNAAAEAFAYRVAREHGFADAELKSSLESDGEYRFTFLSPDGKRRHDLITKRDGREWAVVRLTKDQDPWLRNIAVSH